MANVIFPYFKTALMNGLIGVANGFAATLRDRADQAYNAGLEEYADLTWAAELAYSDDLSHVEFSAAGRQDGSTVCVFDSDDFAWHAVTGDTGEVVVLYANPDPWVLVAWYDEDIAGFPVTPNGGDILCTVHSRGWFQI
jgi:hypothetical protein